MQPKPHKFSKPIRHRDLIQYNWYGYARKGFTDRQRTGYPRTIRYYGKMLQATPAWADWAEILDIYLHAAILRAEGKNIQTDHLVPICSKLVCGLHTPANLRNICAVANGAKSNHHWPDMWPEWGQMELLL